jgi:agmatinase
MVERISRDGRLGQVDATVVPRFAGPPTFARLPRIEDRPVYVSVDIDVLDPAFAPGTGTPEAGRLTSRELLAVLRAFAGANLVGADLVEVAPAYDHAEITGIAASHVAYELVSAMAPRP